MQCISGTKLLIAALAVTQEQAEDQEEDHFRPTRRLANRLKM